MKLLLMAMTALTGLGALAAGAEVSMPERGTLWRVSEWTFVADRDYSAGGGDAVELDMTFTHAESGRTLVRPGFWDGGRDFRVRFAPTALGRWTWKVACPGDRALDGTTGTFAAEPYAGELAIYRHGFVRAEPGKKHFTYADGTPFFYLGDTHWGMYTEEFSEPGPHAGQSGADSHFKYIVRRRAEQGFTVYQSEPIRAPFDVRDGKVDAADIPGFRIADDYYRTIADAGLVHANAEFFFASEMTPEFAGDAAAIDRLCRYWNARFGAYPVLWTLAQEIDNDFYADRKAKHNFYSVTNNPWVKVAESLHRHDAYAHPLSGHQKNTGATTVTNSVFADAAVAKRTGHSWWAAQWSPAFVGRVDHKVTREYWASDRLAVNYEGRYCYLWTKDFGARAQGWLAFLNGFRGYGYGAIDQWLYLSAYDVKKDSHDGFEKISKEDKQVSWSQSIEFPSATEVGLMRTFLEKLPWWELEPDLGTGKFYAPAYKAVGSVASKGGELYVGYFSGTNVYTGKLKGATVNRVYAASWFNPRTGEAVDSSDILANWSGELALPEKPDALDWVLTVTRTDRTTQRILGREVAIRAPNYDRAKIGPYELEDPLTFLDGRKVKDLHDWSARREEILGVFAREMYGQPPPKPEALVTELVDEKTTLAGFATRRQYRMWFKADKTGPAVNWIVWLPRHAKKPAPVVSFLNYRGNHELVNDDDIPVTKAWLMNWTSSVGVNEHKANPRNRGLQQRTDQNTVFPLGMMLARGYAVMSACYGEVSPDVDETPSPFAYTGVFELWGERDESKDDNPTALGAWAWALSRGLDLAERIPEIDARRSVVTGCSRLAKAALIAAARDERFAVCAPVQTGGGGVPLAKRDFGENVSTESRMFPHWYCKAYAKYAADPAKLLTFDQHLFLACIAPRALIVEGFDEDWFDTEGEFLALKAASPVWELLCGKGLPAVAWPACYDTSAIGARVGYVRRSERHGISAQDWTWTLDFADKVFAGPLWADRAAVPRERIEWQDTWIEDGHVQDRALPRVLLLGDSISRQYRKRVSELLAGTARVANSAGSHCVGDPMLAEANAVVLGGYAFDVIVVNNGLHGWNCSDADYARHLAEYVDFLRARAPQAKLVWARTTPMSVKNDLAKVSPENVRVEARNAAADKIMAERGIPAVDLYAAMMEKPAEYHVADGTHFNDKGVEVLAQKIAEAVKAALAQ